MLNTLKVIVSEKQDQLHTLKDVLSSIFKMSPNISSSFQSFNESKRTPCVQQMMMVP